MDSPGSMVLLPLGLRGWFFNVLTATEHIVSMWVLPVGIFLRSLGLHGLQAFLLDHEMDLTVSRQFQSRQP